MWRGREVCVGQAGIIRDDYVERVKARGSMWWINGK